MFDVSLTFDNGPDAGTTPTVLRTLRRHGIAATFFVIGRKLLDPALRAVAAHAHDEGHWVGNHTFAHSVPLGEQDAKGPAREIARTQELIGALAHPDRLFRPYGGGGHLDNRLLSPSAVEHLVQGAYTCVLWNAVPGDWKDPEGWVERAIGDCRRRAWTLLVLHDLPTGAMTHLDRFLGRIGELGGRFRQDFPPDCVPIRNGKVLLPIAPYVATSGADT
ncbi:MAG TPA: polysaccharide deacetylase family protein [Xanthobacteraceae bacterium]|nr:polysaccharide deacetylase family protein [Xanthobacteraceae bacterium]